MASCTKRTQTVRKWHMRKAGKNRKRLLRNKGSTPAFPIHVAPTDG